MRRKEEEILQHCKLEKKKGAEQGENGKKNEDGGRKEMEKEERGAGREGRVREKEGGEDKGGKGKGNEG